MPLRGYCGKETPYSAPSVPVATQLMCPVPPLAQLGLPEILPPRFWNPVLEFVAGLNPIPESVLFVPLVMQLACPVPLIAQPGLPAMVPPRF